MWKALILLRHVTGMQVSSEKPMPTHGNNFHWVNFLIVFGRDWIVLAYTEGKAVQDERNVRARTQIIRAEQSHNTSPQHSTAERATHFSNPDAFQQRQNLVPLSSYFLHIYPFIHTYGRFWLLHPLPCSLPLAIACECLSSSFPCIWLESKVTKCRSSSSRCMFHQSSSRWSWSSLSCLSLPSKWS